MMNAQQGDTGGGRPRDRGSESLKKRPWCRGGIVMKRSIRIVSLVLAVCLVLCGMCAPAFAMQSSRSYRTGLKKGRVLKSGKTLFEGPYKDIYESEKVELN